MTIALERALRDMLGPPPEHLPPDAKRPMVDLELPLGLSRFFTRERLKGFSCAAVLVPLLRRDGGLHVLLTRRADHLRAHSGQVSFPGGRFEDADGHLTVTALREAEEEVGLPADTVEVIGTLHDYPTLTRFLVTPVVGLVPDPPHRFTPDRGEVAEVFEIPLAHLLRKDSFRKKTLTRAGIRVPFYEVEFDGKVVWGATAGMLWDLRGKLDGIAA